MSITYSTYVGPYVRCAVTMVDAPRLQLSCPNTTCHNHGTRITAYRFCALCGTQVASITVFDQEPSVNQWELTEQMEERLTDPSGDGYDTWMRANLAQLWIPNIRTPWRSGRLEERVDFALVPITAEQIVSEQAAFQSFFYAELDTLIVRYGADNVRVEWGVIQDYN